MQSSIEVARKTNALHMDRAWRDYVDERNQDQLHAIVDAVANCMARLLSITDYDEASKKRTYLGRALYEEKEHFPTQEHINELERINAAQRFVVRAHVIANQLRRDADARTNVLLTPFQKLDPFCKTWFFKRQRGEKESCLRVGGLRKALHRDVLTMVYGWLLDCDAAMMIACEDVSHERADEDSLMRLARDYATWIANRLTLMPDDEKEPLSTESLQSRAAKEVATTSAHAEESHRSDLLALSTLETLAREGPRSASGKDALERKLHLLHYAVSKPQADLGLQGINAQHMNLGLLRRACDPEIDTQVRSDMIHQWYQWHGACTACAVAQAIQKLQLWANKSSWTRPFIKVLFTPGEKAPHGAMKMPRMPFVHTAHAWKLLKATPQRTVFDWMQRRCVRLTSLVLQLVGHGGLERGVVRSEVVQPIATQAVLEAGTVLELLDTKREAFSLGVQLYSFCGDVGDRDSLIAARVNQALLHLSKFSMLDLYAVFSQQSPALRVVLGELTYRTRLEIGNVQSAPVVPHSYVAFAYDTLAILLPALRARREHAGTQLCQTVNPLCELLRMVPRVREWTPLQGSLRLELREV